METQYSPGDEDQPFVVTSHRFGLDTTDARKVIDTDAPAERWRFQRYDVRASFGYWQMLHSDQKTQGIAIPHWFLGGLFAVLPVGMPIRRYRTAARVGRGLCVSCGYDLRASEGRCPECGTPVPAEARA